MTTESLIEKFNREAEEAKFLGKEAIIRFLNDPDSLGSKPLETLKEDVKLDMEVTWRELEKYERRRCGTQRAEILRRINGVSNDTRSFWDKVVGKPPKPRQIEVVEEWEPVAHSNPLLFYVNFPPLIKSAEDVKDAERLSYVYGLFLFHVNEYKAWVERCTPPQVLEAIKR